LSLGYVAEVSVLEVLMNCEALVSSSSLQS
jgi:hypothetical protein